MSKVTILVGAQWGDEGKGKWIDILAEGYDSVVRYQGGNNAGHTLFVNQQKLVLHQLPSGILWDSTIGVLTAGVVINPPELLKEYERVVATSVKLDSSRLWLSEKAHVITPWHIHLDAMGESRALNPIGTTKKGIGPTYQFKMGRSGLRLGSYIDSSRRKAWIDSLRQTNAEFADHYETHLETWAEWAAASTFLKDYVCDAESRLRSMMKQGAKVLLEGAQGTLLDIDHGTYPYVTSSSTIAAGAVASVGFDPRAVESIFGIAKAYVTRVGEGPFPTEMRDEMGSLLRQKGAEFGATTGRARRCGWFDAVAMRHVVEVNGLDGIFLNKLDILSGFKEVKIAVAYDHPTIGRLENFPSAPHVLEACVPVYETYSGWDQNLAGVTGARDLPKALLAFAQAVAQHSGTKILGLGVGPGREDRILL